MTNVRPTLISVRNVTKSFKKIGKSVVLNSASFDIPDGSFTIIYGASGSGKSTLLNTLVGLDPPSSGTVSFKGQDMYAMNPNDRAIFRAHTMGMVYQSNHWVKSLNVIDNVAMPLTFLGYSQKQARKEALDSLSRVHMEAFANAYPTDLSGGEQQRIAMARATVSNPSYIVADEPTGNLDSKNGDEIIKLLQYFNKTLQRTIVLVTHNLEYLPVADKLLTIQDGIVTDIPDANISKVTQDIHSEVITRMTRWSQK